MKQKLSYLIKYNRVVYTLYYYLMSFFVSILKLVVRPDDYLILFNSFAGRKYDDSPKEIFLKMKDDPRYKSYHFTWAFHNPEDFKITDANIIKTDNLKYFITALKARVWVTNSSFERGLHFKGKNTFYLNTWHGTPIKLMGSDVPKNNKGFRAKSNSKIAPYDIFCSQGSYETTIFSRTFNIPKERILEYGLPRNDILANHTEQQREEIRKKIGILDGKIAVLYCPTFREYGSEDGGIIMSPPMHLDEWNKRLGEQYVIMIRAHYEVSKAMKIREDGQILDMTSYPSLNELIIASDILISDYSSVLFDYSITGKPMLHFCYDYDKYSANRGMYFDIRDYISGADDEEALINIIKSMDFNSEKEKTTNFRNTFVEQYGNATEMIVNYIANNELKIES